MAENIEQKVLITVDVDSTQADQNIQDLKDGINSISGNAASKSIEQIKQQLEAAGNEAIDMARKFGEGSKQFEQAEQNLLDVRNAAIAAVGGISESSNELQKNAGLMKALYGETSEQYQFAKAQVEALGEVLDGLNVPDVKVDVEVGEVVVPEVDIPSIEVPVTVSDFEIPTTDIPEVEIPVTVSDFEIPTVDIPEVEIPVTVSDFEIPKVDIPTLEVPVVIDDNNSLEALKEKFREASAEAEQMKESFGIDSEQYQTAKAALNEVKSSVIGLTGTYKEQKRELNDSINAAATLFGETSNEVKKLQREMAELDDKFGDLKDGANAFNPDVKFKTLTLAAQTSVVALQGTAGAMAFLGVESETATQTMAKLQGIMAFSDALKSIEGLKVQFKALAPALNATKTSAQGATVATKGLGLAFKAIGIGLLVAAIAYLISNWDDLKKSVTNLFPALKDTGALFDKVKQVAMGFGNALIQFVATPIRSIIKLIKGDFKGAMNEVKNGFEVVKNFEAGANKELAQQRVDQGNKDLEALIKQSENRKKVLEAGGKDSYKLEKDILSMRRRLAGEDLEKREEINQEERELDAGHRKKLEDSAKQAGEKASANAAQAAAKAQAAREKLQNELEKEKETLAKYYEDVNKMNEEAARNKALLNLNDVDKGLKQNDFKFEDDSEKLKEEIENAKQAAKDKYDIEVKLKGDSKELKEQYNTEIANITKTGNEALNNLTQEKAQKDLDIIRKYNDIIRKAVEDDTLSGFEKQKRDITNNYNSLIDTATSLRKDLVNKLDQAMVAGNTEEVNKLQTELDETEERLNKLIEKKDEKLGAVDEAKEAFVAETTLINTEVENRVLETDTPDQRRDKIINVANAQLSAEQEAYEAKKAQLAGQQEELERLEAEHNRRVVDINQAKADNLKKIDEDELAAKKELEQLKMDAVNTGLDIIQGLAGKNRKIADAAFALQKGLAIGQIVTNTAGEISGYFKAATISATNPVQLAAQLAGAAALSTKAKIRAGISIASIAAATIGKFMNNGGAGSATGGGGSESAPVIPQAPQISGTNVTQSGPQDVRVVNEGKAIKAYVVDRDIQNSQQQTSFLNSLSRF